MEYFPSSMDFFFSTRNNLYYEYPQHDHGYWEFVVCINGHGVLIADNETYDFQPGTIFCIRPGVVHTKYSTDGYVDGSIISRDFCFDFLPDKVLVFQDDEEQSFLSLYRLGQHYRGDSNIDSPASRFQRSILDAIQNLLRHWRDEAHMMPELAAFQNYLYTNIADTQFDLDKAILSTGYSPSHFRRLFKEQFGCSPIQYFNQLKIQVAKEDLLRHRAMSSIAQIAENCGFKDPDYFARVFRQVTGMSPSQFYQQSRQGLDGNKLISKSEGL